ncbi:uncharacterized protein LOC116918432 isoform X2 [Daphnia magna]|nr:uncharacterized protein LOC116918432 isoform X2 [Daphnia magna]
MMQAIIVHATPAVTPRCKQCHMETTICVRCASCKEVLCFECDFSYHRTRPFHTRQCMQLDSSFPLKPTQFLDPSGNIFDKYVHVPLFLPTECSNCRAEGSLKCQAGSKSIAVITRDGRFDLSNTSFCCSKCLCIAEASVEMYWNIGLISSISCRGPQNFDVISRVHFARASREYEYMQHQINTKILSRQVMVCKACGVKPKALHVDGNFKLYRWRLSHIKEKAKILVEIPHIPLAVYYTSESHIIRNADTSEFPDQCTTITDAVSTDSPTNFAHPIGKTRRTKAHLKGVPEKRARSEGKQHASSRVKNSVIDLDYHKSITGDVLTRSLITDCAAGQLKIGSRNSCENFSSATPSRTPPFPPTPTPSPTPSFPPTPSPSPIHPVPLPLQISNAIKVNNKDLVKTPEEMFFRGPQGKLLKVVRCTQTYFNSKLNFEPGKYHPFSYILSFLKERILNQESAILVHIVKSDSSLSPMPLSVSP